MNQNRIALLVSVSGIALLGAACGTGGVANAVRPADPTAGNALGETACREGDTRVDPLVVDWKADQRGDLEVAMKEGIAVVSYSCKKGIQVLKDCKIEGSYGYIGITKKEQMVRLENSDEISANLPTAGIGLVGKIQGELGRGATIDVAMITVGKKRTVPMTVTKDMLKGECDGATHFLRGATVGAFVMETGTKAKVKTVVEVFGSGVSAGSDSAKSTRNSDGDATDCAKSSPDAKSAPGQCGAPVRLELVGIKPAVAKNEPAAPPKEAPAAVPVAADVDANEGCPKGLVFASGKCSAPTAEAPFQCHEGNAKECTEQCDKGNAPSCGILGAMYIRGSEATPRDDSKAAPLLKKACDGGHVKSCSILGTFTEQGRGVAKDPAAAATLYEKACNEGEAGACGGLGALLMRGTGVAKDEAKATTVLTKACEGGDPRSCGDLGTLKMATDVAAAGHIFQRGCSGGDPVSCNEYGNMLETGTGGQGRNEMLAGMMYDRGCFSYMSRGYGPAEVCTSAGRTKMISGGGGPGGFANVFLQRACSARDSLACAIMKVTQNSPGPVMPDIQAQTKWRDTCVRGDGLACAKLGIVEIAGGIPNGKQDLEQGCRLMNKWACEVKKLVK